MKKKVEIDQELVDSFHRLFYDAALIGKTWEAATYFGTRLWKSPLDLQLYQELVWEIKPRVILETGTAFGGSALYFAHLLDYLSAGRVLSIDLQPLRQEYPKHPRIQYFGGRSSVDPRVLAASKAWIDEEAPIIVVLDSDHSKEHVLRELDAYSKLVAPGGYLIVEDTNINGNPVFAEFGPGPKEALDVWLPLHSDFQVDRRRQDKYLFSFHTWLRRMRV